MDDLTDFEVEVALHDAHRIASACLPDGTNNSYSRTELVWALAVLEREHIRVIELEAELGYPEAQVIPRLPRSLRNPAPVENAQHDHTGAIACSCGWRKPPVSANAASKALPPPARGWTPPESPR